MGPTALAASDVVSTEVTGSVVVAIALAAFMIGLAKGGLSGLGPMLTLLVAATVPTDVAIGVLLPLLMVGDIAALWAHWGKWDREIIRRLLPGAAAGVVVASVFLQAVSESQLRLFLVIATLGFVAYRLLEPRLRQQVFRPRPWHGVAAGSAAGITSTIAHVGGPPVAAYLLTERVTPRTYVASSAALFFLINWFKVPGYLAAGIIDGELLVTILPTIALIPPGILLGRWIVVRIQQQLFDGLILASLVVGALLLLA